MTFHDRDQHNNDVVAQPVFHGVTPGDRAAMQAMRGVVLPNKGMLRGPAARGPYDAIMERVAAPEDVTYEADTVAGIPGWWCRPESATSGAAVYHLHGGWFAFGSAKAFRSLVGHIAKAAEAAAFVPDYRLAPEHPFPAAMEDVRRCFDGLVDRGYDHIAITGDSAGGGLALSLLASLKSETASKSAIPVGAVVLSPVTDLALTGSTWESRAEADPYFTKDQVRELVRGYLGDHDATDPAASPLYGDLSGLPPVRVHVGDDEVLLDDARRYAERALAAGADIQCDVWEGMTHGFLSGIGKLNASEKAMRLIGEFLCDGLKPKVSC